jgi:hypothetical protein
VIEGAWGIVEMLGHRTIVGRLSEVTVAGAAMLRVEVPTSPPSECLVAASALYAITPCSEEAARARHERPPELVVANGYVDDWDYDEDGPE